ncbi:helicase-associated domain-containing protein [uncultured Pseudokineococcus sp.]|uniref:helicase-associated domain-containing protein n=1 Tax=uncultured Pseudokineococcus sp. TaxID=1642928 RepID=UPI0026215E7D|nr:helicase-associated domain-containing protein [uncultured Pseudokineococcus sp.]
MTDLVEHLSALPPDDLALLLRRRPDAVAPLPPRDLAELAEHLDDPPSLGRALAMAPLPVVQVVEAVLALRPHPTETALRRLLGVGRAWPDPLAEPLGWLVDRLVVRREAGELVPSPGLDAVLPHPLGLGESLTTLLPRMSVAQLQQLMRAHREPLPSRKAECVAAVQAVLGDAERVRAAVDAVASPARESVLRLLSGAPADWEDDRYDDEWAEDDDVDTALLFGQGTPLTDARLWALQRGLALGDTWGYELVVPAEVTLALRGEDWTAPFDPEPPVVPTTAISPEAAEREQAAAVQASAAVVLAVADLVRAEGVPVLRSGGVGARELARLAKRTGTSEHDLRLALGLLGAAGLVQDVEGRLIESGEMPGWRTAEPAVRHAAVLRAWWDDPAVPTRTHRDGRAAPALSGPRADEAHGTVLRQALLGTAVRQPPGTGLDAAAAMALLRWYLPTAEDPADEQALPATWAEATTLGALALGVPTPLGLALLREDDDALVAVTREALPDSVDRAVVGDDLTAVMPGSPSARVTTLLDACADREGRGGAVVWRFTPGSVRRALDAGWTGEQLTDELTDVAGGALPQPLAYLLADVARRHGSLRVRDAVAVVRGDDEALLAQAAADRSLRSLGLVHVASTVLTSTVDAATTVQALRAAGYLPVVEDGDGVVQVTRRPEPPPVRRRPAPEPAEASEEGMQATETLDVDALLRDVATALLSGTPTGPVDERERLLRLAAPQLPTGQARLLLHAEEADRAVVITYRSSSGRITTRAVSQVLIRGRTMVAWCHLREDERAFSLERVLEVQPAGV